MQGLWIREGEYLRRPKSKREVKELVKQSPERLVAEATSAFGGEHSGNITRLPKDAPVRATINFVGPDPRKDRRFYGTIQWDNGRLSCK